MGQATNSLKVLDVGDSEAKVGLRGNFLKDVCGMCKEVRRVLEKWEFFICGSNTK